MSNDLILRAWDKKARKMREVDSIAFYNTKGVGDCSNSKLPKVANLWGFNIITQQDIILHRDIEDVELMQYSGHNDKNGIKIFEYDILKDKNEHIRICIKEDGAFKFPALKESRYFHYPIKNKRPDRRNGLLAFLSFQDQLSRKDKAELEVIGNKYENSEYIPV